MNRVVLGASLLACAVLWVVLLSIASTAKAHAQSASVPAQDGSVAIVKYIDKSRFSDKNPTTGTFGEITLRLDILGPTKAPIIDIKQADIRVSEEGIDCPVKTFTGPSSQAINVIFVIDVSGSMSEAGKIDGAKSATLIAINELKLDRDRVGIIAFDHGFDVIQPLARLDASVKQSCQERVGRLRPRGGTVIGVPVVEALKIFDQTKPDGSKMILVMTDGEDDKLPGYTTQISQMSESRGVPVHSIAFGTPLVPFAKQSLESLASRCHGRFYHAPTNQELVTIFRSRVLEMANECTIVYDSPYPQPDGLPRKVQVSINTPSGVLAANSDYQIGPIIAGARRSSPSAQVAGAIETKSSSAGVIKACLFLGLGAFLVGALIVPYFLGSRLNANENSLPASSGPAASPMVSPQKVVPPPPPPVRPTPPVGPSPHIASKPPGNTAVTPLPAAGTTVAPSPSTQQMPPKAPSPKTIKPLPPPPKPTARPPSPSPPPSGGPQEPPGGKKPPPPLPPPPPKRT